MQLLGQLEPLLAQLLHLGLELGVSLRGVCPLLRLLLLWQKSLLLLGSAIEELV